VDGGENDGSEDGGKYDPSNTLKVCYGVGGKADKAERRPAKRGGLAKQRGGQRRGKRCKEISGLFLSFLL